MQKFRGYSTVSFQYTVQYGKQVFIVIGRSKQSLKKGVFQHLDTLEPEKLTISRLVKGF